MIPDFYSIAIAKLRDFIMLQKIKVKTIYPKC